MVRTALSAACMLLAAASMVFGQSSGIPAVPGSAPSAPPSTPSTSGAAAAIGDTWRAADSAPRANAPANPAPVNPAAASLDAQSAPTATPAVPMRSGGKDMLPNDQGQVWQQYDISAYTSNAKGVEAPEKAIVEWILRETGTEAWFRPPLGLLNATSSTISVYHTPEMQKVVADVIGRFVNGTQDSHVLGLRVVAIDNPSWRSAFMVRMRPVAVQAPGSNAWLLSKEDASLLLAQMRSRADFREFAAPSIVFFNGQSQTVATLRPRVYVKGYRSRTQDNTWTGYDIDRGQIQEGFSLEVSPLLSQDERTIDVVLKCNIDQVEKLVNVGVDLPGFSGQMQRADIQIPQMVSWRLHERFRWPSSQVLLLSCGVIASPGPDRSSTMGISTLFGRTGGRSDALLFVESLGKASQALMTGNTTTVGGGTAQPGARY